MSAVPPAVTAPPLRDPADVRSKTAATWIALVGGSLGLHHFYLRGWRSALGWLYPIPTLVGLAGVVRMRNLGVDDHLAWALIPWLGLTITAAMLCAIVYGLTTDAKWARQHAGDPTRPVVQATREQDEDSPPPGLVHTGWGPVLGVILALMIGGGVLMGTIAFTVERLFYIR
ncbi:MAG TPA: NINE protein [Burkholderiaceae bacterium]